MTGNRWRDFEEDVFWMDIVRRATADSGDVRHPTKTQLGKLIPRMMEELERRGHSAPRTYTATSLYGHWHKNAIQRDYSPQARHHVDAYLKRYHAAVAQFMKDTKKAPKREAAPSPQTAAAAQEVNPNRVFPIPSLDYLSHDNPAVDPATILPNPFVGPQPQGVRYFQCATFDRPFVAINPATIGQYGEGYSGPFYNGFRNHDGYGISLPDFMMRGYLGDPMDGSYSVYADELDKQCKPHPRFHEGGQAIPVPWPPLPSHVVTFTADDDTGDEQEGLQTASMTGNQTGQQGPGSGSGFTQQQQPQ